MVAVFGGKGGSDYTRRQHGEIYDGDETMEYAPNITNDSLPLNGSCMSSAAAPPSCCVTYFVSDRTVPYDPLCSRLQFYGRLRFPRMSTRPFAAPSTIPLRRHIPSPRTAPSPSPRLRILLFKDDCFKRDGNHLNSSLI